MAGRTPEFARKILIERGPYVLGDGWCYICFEKKPWHREYCAWHDYFTPVTDWYLISEEEWNEKKNTGT